MCYLLLSKCNCILACSYSLSHLFSFYNNYTSRRVKWGKHGTYAAFSYPSLTTETPFKSHNILFNARALVLNNTPIKRRLTTSHLPILEPVLKPALPSYTIYSSSLPPSTPDILWASSSPPELFEVLRYTYFYYSFRN